MYVRICTRGTELLREFAARQCKTGSHADISAFTSQQTRPPQILGSKNPSRCLAGRSSCVGVRRLQLRARPLIGRPERSGNSVWPDAEFARAVKDFRATPVTRSRQHARGPPGSHCDPPYPAHRPGPRQSHADLRGPRSHPHSLADRGSYSRLGRPTVREP